MTVLGLTCQNKACLGFGEPISETWLNGKLMHAYCPTCDYEEGLNVVSPSGPIPRGRSETVNRNISSNRAMIFAVAIIVGTMFAVGFVLIFGGGPSDEQRFTTIDVNGARCVYDDVENEIADCDFGTTVPR